VVTNISPHSGLYQNSYDFNKHLFEKKLSKYTKNHTLIQSERFVTKELEEMTIPEFIEEEDWKN